jgi:hypothetical protein
MEIPVHTGQREGEMRKFLWIVPALLLFAAIVAPAARADIIEITIVDATFSAPCVGEPTVTCTEVINGSFDYTTTGGGSSISMTLAGTLAGTFALGPVACTGLCFGSSEQIYIPVAPGDNPIEFSPSIQPCPSAPPGQGNTNPSPDLCNGNPNYETGFIVPTGCGGNQPDCGMLGSFPPGIYGLTSGTYTAVDLTTPEPSTFTLMGLELLGLWVVIRTRAQWVQRGMHVGKPAHMTLLK